MKIFVDCEFNGFEGELISMALVDENGDWWYESLGCGEPEPWVHENVMPVIGIDPIPKGKFQTSLQNWLMRYDSVHIIADWPEDISHFCRALITGPGYRIDTPPLTMEVLRIDGGSAIPHNALADAFGIKMEYQRVQAIGEDGTDAGN